MKVGRGDSARLMLTGGPPVIPVGVQLMIRGETKKRERDPINVNVSGVSKVDIQIRKWEGVREWGNRWMLAFPGPWRLGVAVALRSRSQQTARD